MAASHYRNIDLDLLLTGVVLHDIGKIYELSYERGFQYTERRPIAGAHARSACGWWRTSCAACPGFPPRLRIARGAHDYQPSWPASSSARPRCRSFRRRCCCTTWTTWIPRWNACAPLVERDRHVEGCFTGYSASLERTVLKKAKYLNEEPAPAPKEVRLRVRCGAVAGRPSSVCRGCRAKISFPPWREAHASAESRGARTGVAACPETARTTPSPRRSNCSALKRCGRSRRRRSGTCNEWSPPPNLWLTRP